MKTKVWAIILVLLTTLLTSTAQVFYKIGASNLEFNLLSIITNVHLIAGLGLYAIGACLLILGLRGGDLSVLYPIIAMGFIWVSLYSFFLFGEHVHATRWVGICSIIVGISFIGFGSTKESAIGEKA